MNHCDCNQGRGACRCPAIYPVHERKPALIDHPLVNVGFAIGIGVCLGMLALSFFGVLRP